MSICANATDHYLAQRVAGASPESLVAMLLEAGQRYLGQAMQSLARKDHAAKARQLDRVSSIIEELTLRLDLEAGGELVSNLIRIYGWWNREIFQASAARDPARLANVARLMGDMRATWLQLHHKKMAERAQPAGIFSADLTG